MNRLAPALYLVLTIVPAATAQGTEPLADNSAPLLEELGEQTRIATRTRLNIDYAPGTVNILHGDDLLTQGARTVWEALSLVPGFQQSVDETGMRQILVRGVGATYASGNIKMLLNDVSMNSELTSLANPLLNMPIDQVERIEIIRGPGSAIYGESAYMGVVNVITRKQGRRVFASAGKGETFAGGGEFSYSNEEHRLDLNLNLAGWQSGGSGQSSGPDGLYTRGAGASSFAPGPANDKMDYHAAILGLSLGKFSLTGQWLEDGTGDYFGINYILPPDEKRIATRIRHRAVEAKQALEFASSLQGEFKLGWQDFTRNRSQLYLGPADDPALNGLRLSADYRETRLTGNADLAWEQGAHTVLLGWSFNQAEIAGAGWSANFAGLPANWIDVGTTRTVHSYTLQDQFRAGEAFTVTAGVRHDHYSDVGTSTTPRLAAVWQLAPGHIVKAQYAEAFRAPTFYELNNGGQGGAIRPETIATSELGYLFKGNAGSAGVTLFHSDLRNLIVFQDTPEFTGYLNKADARSQGIEAEGETWLARNVKVSGNLTLLDTRERNGGARIPGAGRWLANAGIEYRRSEDLAFGLQLREVGQGSRDSADTRSPLAAYLVTDVSVRLFNLAGYRGLTLRAGVKNLFDREVRFPAPANTYPGDYPRLPREWWTLMSYSY